MPNKISPDTLRALAQALSDACQESDPLNATGAAMALVVEHAAAHGIGPADLFVLFGRTVEIRLDGEDLLSVRWPDRRTAPVVLQ
jgi:hypothetical protein